jgi:Zn-dependent alcohol dehydrogenase
VPVKPAVCFEPTGRLDLGNVEQSGPRAVEARVKIKAAGVSLKTL